MEVDGKYYLSEERLKQIEEMRSTRGKAWNPRQTIMTLRLLQLVTVVLFVTLLLVNLFVQSWEFRVVSAVFLVVWLLIAIPQIYYLSRARKGFSSQQISKALVNNRVAIVRALINDPTLILADEPTCDFDSENAIAFMDLVKELDAYE